MQKNLAQTLAQIHAEFGIYDRDIFSVADAQNIIYRISSIPELAYLDQFYIDYQCEYLTELQKRPDLHSTPKLTDVSTTVDFPFLGEDVIEGGQAKYMFVFQGSFGTPRAV